ncbi:hypothetical protein [Parageobacillus genomosp. 1]|nr:hypothetical protein [Parageobacillus genomosp. 1]
MPPQRGRSVASRWRPKLDNEEKRKPPELDSKKSGGRLPIGRSHHVLAQ